MSAKLIKYVYNVETRRDTLQARGKYTHEYTITIDGPPHMPRKARDKAYAVMGAKLDYVVGFRCTLKNADKDCYQDIPGWVPFSTASLLPEIS
jgi:hypothetical protein